MNSFDIRDIDEQYNNEMLSIVKASPINANGLGLYFDKSPDIFNISRMKFSASEHLGFFMDEELKGFGSLGYYDALVKGQTESVFSFYNFYLLPEARGKKIIDHAVMEFFSRVKKSPANYGISITLKGNRAVESYLNKKFKDPVPPFRVIDDLVVKTILFSKKKKNNTSYKVRRAVTEDIPAIVKLLHHEHQQRDFGIVFNEDLLISRLSDRNLQIENYFVATNNAGIAKGVCLAWDCSSFRRTTVLEYSSRFYSTLFGYKTLAKIFPLAPFPKKGESFKELTLTDYAVEERDPVIMHALLSDIYHQHNNRKYHFMNWASCGTDRLLNAAKGFWHKDIISQIVFTSMDSERLNIKPQLPYIDIAFI